MSLEQVQQYLTLAAPVAVILGVVIALLQLRHQTRLRQIDTIMRLFSKFGEESFTRHIHRVTNWKYDTFTKFQESANEEDQISFRIVLGFFENMGLLYKRKLVSLDLLDDFASIGIVGSWRSLEPILMGLRAQHHIPTLGEWYELLAEDMQNRLAKLD